jgi:cytidine deaminase
MRKSEGMISSKPKLAHCKGITLSGLYTKSKKWGEPVIMDCIMRSSIPSVPGNEQKALLDAARHACTQAYAPYSHFPVGAAVLDEHGHIHAGCNVENAAYPQGACAEAAALAAMVLAGGRQVRAVAVAGTGGQWITPCGGCRQRLREFGGPDTPIFTASPTEVGPIHTLAELLPHSFGPDHLPGTP